MERHPVATTIVTLEVCRDGRLTIVAELASSPTSNRRVGAGIQSQAVWGGSRRGGSIVV
jgi:hypothetical protein